MKVYYQLGGEDLSSGKPGLLLVEKAKGNKWSIYHIPMNLVQMEDVRAMFPSIENAVKYVDKDGIVRSAWAN